MNKKEIIEYLKSPIIKEKDNFKGEILKLADDTRRKNVGDEVHLRALIEFSNICTCNCLYCGLRADNKKCKRYNLTKQEIIKYSQNAVLSGFKTIILQSGENYSYSTDTMVEIISEIKKFDVALTLSLGEKTKEEYKIFKNAGADRFLMGIETTDRNLYAKMHPNSSFNNRLKSLYILKELGYEIGCGSLVGLPYQTIESIANDILFFKELDVDMIGINPLIVNPDTPLNGFENGNFELALKAAATTRLVLPKANVSASNTMETLQRNGRIASLKSGANLVIINATDYKVNKNYEIYKNKASNIGGIKESTDRIKSQLASIGRTISPNRGDSRKKLLKEIFI